MLGGEHGRFGQAGRAAVLKQRHIAAWYRLWWGWPYLSRNLEKRYCRVNIARLDPCLLALQQAGWNPIVSKVGNDHALDGFLLARAGAARQIQQHNRLRAALAAVTQLARV